MVVQLVATEEVPTAEVEVVVEAPTAEVVVVVVAEVATAAAAELQSDLKRPWSIVHATEQHGSWAGASGARNDSDIYD